MKNRVKIFEEFKSNGQIDDSGDFKFDERGSIQDDVLDEAPSETNHTKYLNSLAHMNADQIRQEFLEGNLNTNLRKKVASKILGEFVMDGTADKATKELFHSLSDSNIEL